MKKIGWGWQVSVYEYSGDRVYKKLHTFWGSLFSIIKTTPVMIFLPHRLISWSKDIKNRQLDSLSHIKTRTDLWPLMGRPIIELSGNYYQDKAVPLRKYFRRISDEQAKNTIDDFVNFSFKLFQEGLIDKSFNFLKNFGMYENKVILLDLGELFHDPKEIKRQIEKRSWKRHYVLRIIPKQHRLYFIKKMDERFLL